MIAEARDCGGQHGHDEKHLVTKACAIRRRKEIRKKLASQ